jgi:hypothetical protein
MYDAWAVAGILLSNFSREVWQRHFGSLPLHNRLDAREEDPASVVL